MTHFEGRIAAITGAGSGIGRALARALNAAGCQLELSDINAEGLQGTANSLPRRDLACHSQVLDIADRAAVEAWAADVDARHGRLDILVNNAGVALSGTAEQNAYEDIEWLMGVNFWGVVYGCKSFLPLLRRSSDAHLVNISSIFGIITVPTQSAYHAAKFAVRGYTESLRQELSDTAIHVCCVHPGGVRTNIARDSRHDGNEDDRAQLASSFEELARTTPEQAAESIMGAMRRRRKRLLIGRDARLMALAAWLFPVSYPAVLGRLLGANLDNVTRR